MSSGFFQQRSLEGWDIAYDSRRQHGVGVISPDLLPTDNLLYRYYFFSNPIPEDNQSGLASFGGGIGSLGVGSLGFFQFFSNTELALARDKVEFILDFVSSIPRFDILLEATANNIFSPGILEMPAYYLTIAYIFRVDVDANGTPTHIYNRSGTQFEIGTADGQVELPARPNPDERGRDWFEYYDSFKSGGAYADYNMFDGQYVTNDFNYTYNNRLNPKSTDTYLAKVQGLAAGQKYLITYEAISKHIYRQHVKINLLQTNFIMLNVNISANTIPPFVENLEIHHYLWKEWTTGTGANQVTHAGWRISESWMSSLKVHQLQDPDSRYDTTNNPRVGYESGRLGAWALFNMSNSNLATYKDDQRIGYNRNYAEAIYDSRSEAATQPTANTNEIIPYDPATGGVPNSAHINNFDIEYVSKSRVVNYGTDLNSAITWESGGAMGVLFRAQQTEYAGHWESMWYGMDFPSNTRIVNVFNDSQHGNNGNVIAAYTKKRPVSLSMLEDPYFFFVKSGKLYQRFFDDAEYNRIIGGRTGTNQFELEHRTAQSGAIGEKEQNHPGRSIITGEYEFRTYVQNNLESAPTVKDSSGNTVNTISRTSTLFVAQNITSSAGTILNNASEVDSTKTIYKFGITIDSSRKYSSVKMKLRMPSTASFKVRGWRSTRTAAELGKRIDWDDEKSEREIAGVDAADNEYFTVDLLGWDSVAFLEVISDSEITSISDIVIYYIDPSNDLVISDVDSIAAAADKGGNFMIFYTNKDGRLNLLSTSNAGFTWDKIEHIVMRGDKIKSLSGIVNREEDAFMLFYFYKDALLCQRFDLDLLEVVTRDINRKGKALDTIRLQWANLVYGDALKPASEKQTRTDSAGNIVFEDINDNLILNATHLSYNQSRLNPVRDVVDATNPPTNTVQLNQNNRFIWVGTDTSQAGLATDNPTSTDYDVYQNTEGVLRLFIRENVFGANFTYRCLESSDDGTNWTDAWNYEQSVATDKVARINYLSLGVDSEEGTNIYLLYNNGNRTVYFFYFYRNVLLCKIANESMFSGTKNEIATELSESPLFAVAGLLTNVEDESSHLANGNIHFGTFQQNQVNVSKYYSRAAYAPQKVCGYVTKEGYVRVFMLNDNDAIDAYFFDGDQWRPEHAIINNASTGNNL